MKTETMINPHFYHEEPVKRDFFVTNAKIEDQSTLFKPPAKSEFKTKNYAEFTTKFDHEYNKVGFRE